MNIDVTALQTVPELATVAPGLRPPKCWPKTNVYQCTRLTCWPNTVVGVL
jgi:hypothetical protein